VPRIVSGLLNRAFAADPSPTPASLVVHGSERALAIDQPTAPERRLTPTVVKVISCRPRFTANKLPQWLRTCRSDCSGGRSGMAKKAHALRSSQLAARNVQPETVTYPSEARTVMMIWFWLSSSAMMSPAALSLFRRRA
jgi:hypothetical protein